MNAILRVLPLGLMLLGGSTRGDEPAANSPSVPTEVGRHQASIKVGDQERTYILRIPRGYDGKTNRPLVLMLHGRGGNGTIAERAYGWSEKAEAETFILACPNALPDPQGQPAWNSGYNAGARGRAEDVKFLTALIDALETSLKIDSARIYVCGHSSGGMMSYRLGAELSDRLAAIGVCAGSIGINLGERKVTIPQPRKPLSVIHFHGKADAVVPYDSREGVETKKARAFRFLSAPESVEFWAKADGCDLQPETEKRFEDNVVRTRYPKGREGTEVVLYTIVDGNHRWPGGRANANRQINATDLMWDFFSKHSREPAPAGAK